MRKSKAYILVLSLLSSAYSFAGSEDWNGTFHFKADNGKIYTITHSPDEIRFLVFRLKRCNSLGKGITINGLTLKENVTFCVNYPVEKFVAEVRKLGLITEKNISLGPTYNS